jgi:hypothetical protein
MQDSDHDWERESKQMHRIYAKALLNIAASGAPNSNAGLFRYRNPDLSSRSVKKLKLPRGNVVLIPEPDILAATIIGGPLAKRGWVLQEQLLACRALYFGEQLFWECTENWACETLPEGPTGMLSLLGNPTCFAIQQSISGIISPKEFHYTPRFRQASLYAVWDSICMEYSRRLLTRHSDKEVALSGIAEYFKSLLSEEYIAGLWKGDLIPGLLWFTETSGDLQTLKDIAPSWSWLSPNAGITYAYKDRRFGHYVASVSRVSMKATTDDAAGPRTKDISIVLFGVLRPFQWHSSDLNQRPQDSCDLLFDGDIAIPAIGRRSKTARGIIRLDSEENGQLYMCPLVLFEDQDTRQTKLEGLLLTHDGNSDVYHRVGYFEVTSFAQIFYRKLSPTLRKVNSNPWDYFENNFGACKASKRNNDFWGLFPHDQEVGISQENNFAFRGRLKQWLESPFDEVFEPLFGQIVEII